jgi:predicted nucleotidyltransferase
MPSERVLETEEEIVLQVKRKVEKKVSMKRGLRKKLKKYFETTIRKILIRIFSSHKIKVKKYDGKSHFGCDLLGRDIEDGLRKYVEILRARNVNVHTLILLGSRVKGAWNPESDVDVTIIANNLPREGKNILSKRLFGLRRRIILSDRPLYLGIEPSGCCSKNEFLRRLRDFDVQVLDALYYGQIIYDDGFWKEIKKEYERIKNVYRLNDLLMKKLLFPL